MSTRFASIFVVVLAAAMLLAIGSLQSANAAPTNEEAYTCYKINEKEKEKEIKVKDQFTKDDKKAEVDDARLLCAPAKVKFKKHGDRFVAAEDETAETQAERDRKPHLKCFDLDIDGNKNNQGKVDLTPIDFDEHEFKKEYDVEVKKEQYLCIWVEKEHSDRR